MKKQRALDYDGLDGILRKSEKPESKPALVKYFRAIPVITALVVSVLLLQKLYMNPSSLLQNFSSKVSEQTSSQASHEDSKIQETPVSPNTKLSAPSSPENEPPANITEANEGQTIAHSKAQVISTLPAQTALIPGDDKAKPSANNADFTVYFKLVSNKKPQLSKAGTRKLIHIAQRCPNLISLTGHTCNLGTDAANQLLGWARASALKKLLIAHGIDRKRIITASKGMRKPAKSNDTLSGRASNRRAELYCLEP
ncbi:MAG: OmpA family protein [Methylococcales bacterium]|nr:OmpA family protein [Methylococcales bacterium]